MDAAYAMKLEQAAQALDDVFPEMLFNPMMNDFGDLYFKIDIEDYGQEAVQVDPRFTRRNILRIRGSTKRIDRYLEWTSLYDDYMEYIHDKYGSLEMAQELEDAGVLKDPLPSIDHRPILRKGKVRRLFKKGIVPSFMPHGLNEADCYAYIKHICDQIPEDQDPETPDINWALKSKMTKEEKEIMQRNAERYRRQHRLEILASGTSANGITSNMNFIDNYYANVHRGAYDTEFSDRDKTGESLSAQMSKMETRKYRHLGQVWSDEDSSGKRLSYDGAYIRDSEKEHDFTILKHLQEYTGIDVLGTMTGKGVSKKRIKAARAGMSAVGADVGLSNKERKKLKKKQRKLANMKDKSLRADQRLAEVLLNNKICMNGGTVRFEDMRRVRRSDDDD